MIGCKQHLRKFLYEKYNMTYDICIKTQKNNFIDIIFLNETIDLSIIQNDLKEYIISCNLTHLNIRITKRNKRFEFNKTEENVQIFHRILKVVDKSLTFTPGNFKNALDIVFPEYEIDIFKIENSILYLWIPSHIKLTPLR